MIWLRTLFLVALWAVAALLAHWLIGDPAGWIVFSVAMVAMLLWRSWRLHLVSHWAHHPDTSPPASVGPWDDILAPLYRYTRARARELAETRDTMQGMLAAAQALPDGAVTLNEDFQIDWCNRMARQHLGLRLPADRGHNLLNLLRAPEFVEYAHRASWPDPILVRLGQNGQERLMMMQLTAYASNQRLLITRDVTQIERLETTRRDFVANVSHELRTPLTVLAGFLETLRDMPDDALPAEQRAQYLDMMHEQAQRMQAIVEDLLTLSTLESSPGGDPRAVNIGALLQKARQQIEALSGGRHKLEWHVDESLDVLGAETELTSALSNLLTNAVRYTPTAAPSPCAGNARTTAARTTACRTPASASRPATSPADRALLPRGSGPFARRRRHRTGPGHHQAHRHAARRRAADQQRTRQGQHLRAALPARTDRGGRQRLISRRAAPRARPGGTFRPCASWSSKHPGRHAARRGRLRDPGLGARAQGHAHPHADRARRRRAACAGWKAAPTTTWSSPSPFPNSSRGCRRCCAVAARKSFCPAPGRPGTGPGPTPRPARRPPPGPDRQEFNLLVLLLRRQGQVLSRTTLAEQVWDMNFDSDTNVIDVAVRRLRGKLDDPFDAKLLHTVRGMGYVLESRPE